MSKDRYFDHLSRYEQVDDALDEADRMMDGIKRRKSERREAVV